VETTKLEDHFSLAFISGRLMNFRIPADPFDPTGDWQLDYGVYTFASQSKQQLTGGLVGRMRLARKALAEGEANLTLDYEKNGPGTVQKVAGEIRCRTDALSTPVRWEYSAEVVDSQGKPYENSKIAKRAEAADGRVEIADTHSVRRFAINGPSTINWAVWDAVMRMAREPAEPIHFSMLDHFDQLKRRQTLAFRKSVVVTLRGRHVTLHAFEHVGEGIVPWIYWVDDQGRLLFVVSGLEVYVLGAPHGRA